MSRLSPNLGSKKKNVGLLSSCDQNDTVENTCGGDVAPVFVAPLAKCIHIIMITISRPNFFLADKNSNFFKYVDKRIFIVVTYHTHDT